MDAFETFALLEYHLEDTYHSTSGFLSIRDRHLLLPQPSAVDRAIVILKPEYSPADLSTVLEALEADDFIIVTKAVKLISAESAALITGDLDEQKQMCRSADDIAHVCSSLTFFSIEVIYPLHWSLNAMMSSPVYNCCLVLWMQNRLSESHLIHSTHGSADRVPSIAAPALLKPQLMLEHCSV